ncbi:RNA ligase-domain-containing protein [Annulohypoxylon nitens]|nr:RNA ligase-domain-containing protein [Annulohypoxylon nitens]
MSRQIRRKLVTLRRISSISPIAGSKYEVVSIDGWNVVVCSNEEFYDGQLVLYFEVDSLLPPNHHFWEFSACSNSKSGYVVKSMMRCNHISQGLIFHLHKFPEVEGLYSRMEAIHGTDTAERALMKISFDEMLGVKKWENADGRENKFFRKPPIFFPQPGCQRVQNLPYIFEDYEEDLWQITEKLDGLPMSVYTVQSDSQWHALLPSVTNNVEQTKSTRIGVCSRTLDLIESKTCLFWEAARKQSIIEKIDQIGVNMVVQGELCGSDILRNSIGFEPGEHTFFVFGIFSIDDHDYLRPKEVKDICDRLGWEHAPIISDGVKLSTFADDVHDLLSKAEGVGLKGRTREGLVFKTHDARFAFKAISNAWLLESEKEYKEDCTDLLSW